MVMTVALEPTHAGVLPVLRSVDTETPGVGVHATEGRGTIRPVFSQSPTVVVLPSSEYRGWNGASVQPDEH